MLTAVDLRLLSALSATRPPLNVGSLARALGLSQPLVSQRLRRLEREGLVHRTSAPAPAGREVYYRPQPVLMVQWVSPSEGVALEWQGRGEVDWSFPLVNQIPDLPGQHTMLALLRRLRDRSLLDPTRIGQAGKRYPHPGLTLIVYGSCARGTARPGSDLDLITVQDEARQALDVGPLVESLAAEVSLSAPRPIQLKHLKADDLVDLPEFIRESVQKEGLLVYDGLRTKPGGTTRGAWDFVYGGRTPARV